MVRMPPCVSGMLLLSPKIIFQTKTALRGVVSVFAAPCAQNTPTKTEKQLSQTLAATVYLWRTRFVEWPCIQTFTVNKVS